MPRRLALGPAVATAALCLLLMLPYLPSLGSFFASDDWVWLYYYGRDCPAGLGRFFSPEVIWFYRPLQALQFSVFYHLFGLQPLPYNAALLGMHLGVCALVFLLFRSLLAPGPHAPDVQPERGGTALHGRPWLAAVATVLFAAHWAYLDVVLWKSNYNTLHWALTALGACLAFDRYLASRRCGLLWASYGLTAAGLFAKETAVATPLLLALVWAYRAGTAGKSEERPPLLREGVRLLVPPFALSGLYVAAHLTLIRDVYPSGKLHYAFVSPQQALRQAALAYNHALLSFTVDPALLPQLPWLQAAFRWVAGQLLGLAPALAIYALWRRDRLMLFGLGFFLAAFLPCVALTVFHSSRFYYVPVVGIALVQARILERVWERFRPERGGTARLARMGVAVAAAYLVLSSVATTAMLVQRDTGHSPAAAEIFRLIRSRRGQLTPGCLVVLRGAPDYYFRGDIGNREMVRLALDDPAANGVQDGQKLAPDRLAEVQSIRPVYLLDAGARPMRLDPIVPNYGNTAPRPPARNPAAGK